MYRTIIYRGRQRPHHRTLRESMLVVLTLVAASCVPAARLGLAPAAAPIAPSREMAVLDTLPPAPIAAALAPVPEAQVLNAALPFVGGANPAALPFLFHGAVAADARRSLDCLTGAIYYEAASEAEAGQRAVAQVVLNRVRHPGYPKTVCGVVYQGPSPNNPGGGCQFTFTCDGSLLRAPSVEGWARARRIAADALAGEVYAPVGLATHYHADYVLPPWATTLAKVAAIGRHIFYRIPGSAGAPAAFADAYAGHEPLPVPARSYRAQAALDFSRIPTAQTAIPAAVAADPLPQVRYTGLLPLSRVRPEYARSGTPLADLR